ncbi:MAG: LPS-assembly protein LptD [Kiritimatiellae bacterium]|nr:LPS-assembly protein LptD [Kiritimatiellia bacterium]
MRDMTLSVILVSVILSLGVLPEVQAQESVTIPIEAEADELEYDRAGGWVHARGNVTIKKGGQILKADTVRVNTTTEDAYAEGNVWFQPAEGAKPWTGESAEYNFKTREGIVTELSGMSGPFTIDSDENAKQSDGSYVAREVSLTTCTNSAAHRHYGVRASKLTLIPDEYLKCRHARFYAGRIPIFYLPYFKTDFDSGTGWHFEPGYSSDMGAFLLSSYRQKFNSTLKGDTHLDYRAERGVAFGQDVLWSDPGNTYEGMLSGYYIDDDKPFDEADDETKDIKNERYRFHVDHSHAFGDRSYLLVNADYVSDEDLLEDFFEDDFRSIRQPDNYLVYTYRGDDYTASLQARKRLNDFYSDLDRMPEGSIDFQRRRLGHTAFYYEGRTSVGYLEKLFTDDSNDEDYSSFRFDTANQIYMPQKYFGFLNVIPRAGYRGTYYSDTVRTESETVIEDVTTETFVINANGTTSTVTSVETQTNIVTQSFNNGAEMRSLFELGFDVSFKAFKLWEGGVVTPLRHVVEPYAKYTFVPEPSVGQEDLYQFDRVDTLGEQHNVRLGVQNRWQTKRGGSAWQLADVDVWTWYRFSDEYDEDGDGLDDIFLDADVMPNRSLRLDFDGRYDTEESELVVVNSRLRFLRQGLWRGSLEHRFRKDDSNLIASDVTLFPHRNWDVNVFGRYEFEESRMEEVGGYLQRNLDCMKLRLGVMHRPGYTTESGSDRDDEWRARIEFWLTAFPEVGLSARYKQ